MSIVPVIDPTFSRALIALVGPTGSGKTTFAQLASGDSSLATDNATVQHTKPFRLDGIPVPVSLVDTPGFRDDPSMDDDNLLKFVRTALGPSLQAGTKLSGVICLQRISDVRVGRGYVQGRKWSVLKELWPDQDLGRISVILWSTISAATLRASNVCYNTSDDAQVSFERHNNTTTSSHSIIRRILEADVQFLRTQRVVTEKMRQDYEKQLHSYRWQLNLAWHKDADLQEELRIAQAEIVKYREEKEQNARRIEELATRLHSKRRYPSGTQFHLQALGDGNTIQTSEKEDIHDKLFKILAEECSDNCPVCHASLSGSNTTSTSDYRAVFATPSSDHNWVPFCGQCCHEVALCLCSILSGCLQGPGDERMILNLRDNLAQKALNVMQKIADNSPQYQKPLRTLLLRLAKVSDKLPTSLFLHGVLLSDSPHPDLLAGGFADIHVGKYDNQEVALKVIRVFSNMGEKARHEIRQKLYYEALLWRNIDHAHILPFLGICHSVCGQNPCMVSEYMTYGHIRRRSEHLLRYCQREDLYFHRYIFKWIFEIALGLEYLHEEGISHGDLRGPNILIDDRRSVRLADFGLSVYAETNSRENGSSRGGNERWMAPEQIVAHESGKGFERPTFSSDVFSLACVCVEIYTSREPYYGLNFWQVLSGVPRGVRPTPTCYIDGVKITIPEELTILTQKCWTPEPTSRPKIGDIVNYMANLQIPWVSTPLSECWPLPGDDEDEDEELDSSEHDDMMEVEKLL